MNLIDLWTACSGNGIVLTPEQMKTFERFHGEMLYWNKQVNLISRKDEENLYERHILHSLTILKYFTIPQKAKCIDVGTGGGFPGIPLAIARPDIHMLLVDSIAKKMKITGMIASHVGNRQLQARTARVETLAGEKEFRNSFFDVAFARAVAPLEELIGWTRGILKREGHLVTLKGGDLSEEILAAQEKYPDLKVREEQIKFFGTDWFEKEEKKVLICSFT